MMAEFRLDQIDRQLSHLLLQISQYPFVLKAVDDVKLDPFARAILRRSTLESLLISARILCELYSAREKPANDRRIIEVRSRALEYLATSQLDDTPIEVARTLAAQLVKDLNLKAEEILDRVDPEGRIFEVSPYSDAISKVISKAVLHPDDKYWLNGAEIDWPVRDICKLVTKYFPSYPAF
jgi:hypothetical protein